MTAGTNAALGSFDVSTQPWIPVRTSDGFLRRVGLRDALVEAHQFAGIEHPIPLVEAGVWRLLIALALDIFKPETRGGLIEMLKQRRFDEGAIDAYFAEYGEAFDLFSGTRPFLQDSSAGGEEKPLAGVLPSV